MTAPGFAETTSLNERETCVVAVRRGEAPQLRFADLDRAAPHSMTRAAVDGLVSLARAFVARGATVRFSVIVGDGGRTVAVDLAAARVEPLIELLQRTLKFSEGE